MLEKVRRAICDYAMLEDSQDVVCALSGGADSVAMTLCLKELGYNVCCVHINHNLRGEESDSDEAFCKDFCQKHNILLKVFSVDVKNLCEKESLSCEEAARKLRYECLEKYAIDKKIATAHSLDDNLETMLFNITRGAGLTGLCGIPAKRENIIRPLIYVSRAEIEAYLEKLDKEFVTDSTNNTDDFSRNKIRHSCIPVLKDINQNVLNNALCTRKTLEAENAFIISCANEAYALCFDGKSSLIGLKNYDKALRRRCIMRLLSQKNIEKSFERIEAIDNMLMLETPARLDVGNGFDVICRKGNVILNKRTKAFSGFQCELKIGKNTFLSDKTVYTELLRRDEISKINILLAKNVLDYDKIKGNPFLRCRRQGDKIKLCNRNFTSSVKTLLNASFERENRDSLCFICDDEGLVFIEGIGIADRVKIDVNTKRVLKVTINSD